MKVAINTLEAIAKTICGDDTLMPYMSGPKLVQLFNAHGFNDHYPESVIGSRPKYTLERLKSLNGNDRLRLLVNYTFDPRHFIEHTTGPHAAAEKLNKYLKFDKFELAPDEDHFKIRGIGGVAVTFEPPTSTVELDQSYIQEQIKKCEKKIAENDYDGAITNARTMVEAVLIRLEKKLSSTPVEYDGDLPGLYKRVQKVLQLHQSRQDISDTLKQVLTGLVSIVNGLAGMRNKMSDAHAGYKPAKHHATLAVNTAKTLSDFLYATFAYQEGRKDGKL